MKLNLGFIGVLNNIAAMTTATLLLLIIVIVLLIIILVVVIRSSSKKNKVSTISTFKSTKKEVADSSYYAKSVHGRRKVLLTKK